MIRSDPCPACGTVVHADVPRWVHDMEQRLATLADRHKPNPYPSGEPNAVRYCNACGQTWMCPDARIIAGMETRD